VVELAGRAYPRIHLLHEFLNLLEDHGATAASRFRQLQDLTPLAVLFHYEEFSILDANLDQAEVIRQVSEFIDHMERLIRKMETAG
jgi:hypothetical protein